MRLRKYSGILQSILLCSVFLVGGGCEKEKKAVQVDWAQERFSGMTETCRIGQLFCISVDPIKYFLYPDYKSRINTLISKYKPGAVYFPANIDTVKMEIRLEFDGNKLNDEILAMQHMNETPMFIAADFESGAWTWDINATRFPFPLALAAARSGEFAYRQGKITAVEAHAQGLNWILSPMLNTDFRGWNRMTELNSFGSDPEIAGTLGVEFLTGCQEAGVAGCVKFFPDATTNSLFTETADSISPEQLSVFEKTINAGVASVMCSPISLDTPSWDSSSKNFNATVRDILVNRLGYKGMIVAPLVSKLTQDYAESEMSLVKDAINAGVTMFLLPETENLDIPLLDALFQAEISGDIDMNRIDESVRKILAYKSNYGITDDREKQTLRSMVGIGLPEYLKNSRDISDNCITLMKNDNHAIPADLDKQYVVSFAFLGDKSSQFSTVIEGELGKISDNIRHLNVFGIPDERIEYEILQRATEADVVICSFIIKPNEDKNQETLDPEIVKLMKRITAASNKVVVVSFYDPHIIKQLSDIQTYLISYSPSESSIAATFEVIFGIRDAEGILPLDISEQFPAGTSLRHTIKE